MTNDHLIPGRSPDLVLINKKKEHVILYLLMLRRPTEGKIKVSEKIDKYLDLVKKKKKTHKKQTKNKLWNMRETVMPIAVSLERRSGKKTRKIRN